MPLGLRVGVSLSGGQGAGLAEPLGGVGGIAQSISWTG